MIRKLACFLIIPDNAGESFRPIRALPSTADLFMSEDNRHGISCQYENGVVITNDNWQTETRIPTPYDQGLIRAENYPGKIWWNFERCYRVYLTDSLYLLYQCADWFLTRRDTIQWQLLPEQGVSSIIANPENGKVVLLKSNHVLQTADFQSYDTLPFRLRTCGKGILKIINTKLVFIQEKLQICNVFRINMMHAVRICLRFASDAYCCEERKSITSKHRFQE